MIIVGLTGNYGMGKSTVLRMFRELGALTMDADQIVDALLKEEPVLAKIKEAFGEQVFTVSGSLDRARLASIVFKDADMRKLLEGIIHPLVFERIEQFLSKVDKKGPVNKVVVIEIPLMFESGRLDRFHKTITVYAERDVALRRLADKGVGREEAESRLATQMNIDEKIRRSDFVVDNSGGPEKTRAQVNDIYQRLLSR